MRMVTITADVPGRLVDRLDEAPKEMKKGLKDVLNEMAKESREELYAKSRSRYTLKAGKFRKSDIRIRKATVLRAEAVLTVSGQTESVKSYRIRRNTIRKGVRAEVIRGSGWKELKMKNGSLKAFVAGVTTGHTGITHTDVFQRVGSARFPIRAIHGPSRAKLADVLFRDMQDEKGNELTRRVRALAERTLS